MIHRSTVHQGTSTKISTSLHVGAKDRWNIGAKLPQPPHDNFPTPLPHSLQFTKLHQFKFPLHYMTEQRIVGTSEQNCPSLHITRHICGFEFGEKTSHCNLHLTNKKKDGDSVQRRMAAMCNMHIGIYAYMYGIYHICIFHKN